MRHSRRKPLSSGDNNMQDNVCAVQSCELSSSDTRAVTGRRTSATVDSLETAADQQEPPRQHQRLCSAGESVTATGAPVATGGGRQAAEGRSGDAVITTQQ